VYNNENEFIVFLYYCNNDLFIHISRYDIRQRIFYFALAKYHRSGSYTMCALLYVSIYTRVHKYTLNAVHTSDDLHFEKLIRPKDGRRRRKL